MVLELSDRNSSRRRWVPPLFLAALLAVVFAPVLFGGQVFYHLDIQQFFLPFRALARDFFFLPSQGLWNPFVAGGMSLIGNGQAALFYPLHWIFLPMPPELGLSFSIIFHFLIAGLGMYWFGLTLGLGRIPATIAGVIYMLCGATVTRAVHLSLLCGAALLPAISASFVLLLERPSRRRFVMSVCLLSLQILCGHPQIPIYYAYALFLALTLNLAAGIAAGRGKSAGLALGMVGGVYIGAACVAAIMLLPWAESVWHSTRGGPVLPYEFMATLSFPPQRLLAAFIPYHWGNIGELLLAAELSASAQERLVQIMEYAVYVGIPALCLFVLGLSVKGPSRLVPKEASLYVNWRQVLIVFLVFGGIVACGLETPLGPALMALPLLAKMRAWTRALTLSVFAAAALAGFGADWMLREGSQKRQRIFSVVCVWTVMAVLVANFLCERADWQSAFREVWRSGAWLVSLSLLGVSSVLIIFGRGRLAGLMLLALVTVDLGVFAGAFNPLIPAARLDTIPPAVAFLKTKGRYARVASFAGLLPTVPEDAQAVLHSGWSARYRIPSINVFDTLQSRYYTDLFDHPGAVNVTYGMLPAELLSYPRKQGLDLMNVRYLVFPVGREPPSAPDLREVYRDKSVVIFENDSSVGPVYLARTVQSEEVQDTLQRLRFGPPRPATEAVINEPLSQGENPPRVLTPADASWRAVMPDTDSIEVQLKSSSWQYLVFSQPFYPGWEVRIDGVPTESFRTNYLMRGVWVPPGKHMVVLQYRPWSFNAGALISSVAALTLLLLALGRLGFGKERA
ncbi:MAG: YfhO family protein [Deltaproteobacteria bacterium]|nr:YfhO family protein [Deltaproteobacteria bacterium]